MICSFRFSLISFSLLFSSVHRTNHLVLIPFNDVFKNRRMHAMNNRDESQVIDIVPLTRVGLTKEIKLTLNVLNFILHIHHFLIYSYFYDFGSPPKIARRRELFSNVYCIRRTCCTTKEVETTIFLVSNHPQPITTKKDKR